jgi:hypothetical protein
MPVTGKPAACSGREPDRQPLGPGSGERAADGQASPLLPRLEQFGHRGGDPRSPALGSLAAARLTEANWQLTGILAGQARPEILVPLLLQSRRPPEEER